MAEAFVLHPSFFLTDVVLESPPQSTSSTHISKSISWKPDPQQVSSGDQLTHAHAVWCTLKTQTLPGLFDLGILLCTLGIELGPLNWYQEQGEDSLPSH